jgi:hypothetical protein
MMLRVSRLIGAAAVAALAASVVSPAFAGQLNSSPTHQTARSGAFALGGLASGLSLNNNAVTQNNLRFGGKGPFTQANRAPTVSTALSTALSVSGPAQTASINSNLIDQGNFGVGKRAIQFNGAPTVQTAVGTAVSIGGDASATAANSNGIAQESAH